MVPFDKCERLWGQWLYVAMAVLLVTVAMDLAQLWLKQPSFVAYPQKTVENWWFSGRTHAEKEVSAPQSPVYCVHIASLAVHTLLNRR